MTFNQWLRQYRMVSGLRSVAGNTAMLRQDYKDGYTPEQAYQFNKRGYGPEFHALAANAEKWMRLVG